jgi:serine/threonine protein kinase
MSKIEIIGQGSYGCVYKPSIQCDGTIKSDKYISKIQLEEQATENEKAIGQKIIKISKYSKHFAPIVESCKLNISKLKKEDLDKCLLYEDNSDSPFESNKIKYVGKHTLSQALYILLNKYPKLFIRLLIKTNVDLLKSVHLLNSNNIIHMDIKEDNIMIKDKDSSPIMIDFGISFDVTAYEDKKTFFTYGYDYPPWCFEITLITYIINKIEDKWEDAIVNEEDVNKVIGDYLSYNKVFIGENDIMEPLLNAFVKPYINKKYKLLYDECFKSVQTWDSYGLCVMYYRMLSSYDLIRDPSLQNYVTILESVIFCNPAERISTKEIIKSIKNEFNMESIKASKTQISKKISSMGKNKQEKINKNVKKSYLEDLEQTKVYHELQTKNVKN